MAAIARLLDWYVHATGAATRPIRRYDVTIARHFPPPKVPGPDITEPAQALACLDAEYANLIAAIRRRRSLAGACDALPRLLHPYFVAPGYGHDSVARLLVAETATHELDDAGALAHTLTLLGKAYLTPGRRRRHGPASNGPLALHQRTGDRHGEATARNHLGTTHRRVGEYVETADRYRAAIDLFARLDDRRRLAMAHST